MDWIWALIIGAIAGFFAGTISTGKGFGLVGNVIIGVLGAVVGNVAFGLIGIECNGVIGNIIGATLGALILLWGLGVALKKKA